MFSDIVVKLLRQEGLPEWLQSEMALNRRVEGECFKALQKIQAVVDDDRLDDPGCFMRVEEIVRILEETGSGGGFRHDFG